MSVRNRYSGLPGIALLASLALSLPAIGQEQFPDAPGRETMLLVCSQCHSIGKMVLADLTAEDWEFIVYDMTARGAPLHQEDIKKLITYLQDNFATDKP